LVLELNRFLDHENLRQAVASFGAEQKSKDSAICTIEWGHTESALVNTQLSLPALTLLAITVQITFSNYGTEERHYGPWSNSGDTVPHQLGDSVVDQH